MCYNAFMLKQKNILFSVVLVGSLLMMPARPAYAFWTDAIPAAFLKQAMEESYKYVQGTLLGSLKVAAYTMLSQQISSLISGNGLQSGAGAQFITNWESFIYQDATFRAKVAINDFYTTSLRGMFVSGSYSAAGGYSSSMPGGASSGGWPGYLKNTAEAAISGETPQYTLDQYCPDPSVMFDTKDLRCFNAYFENPMNNPYGYTLAVQEKYTSDLRKYEDIAKTQAIAYQGYRGVTDDAGNTVTPGSTVGQLQASMNSHLLGLPMSATNPAEIATMTASTFVTSLLQQAMQQGMARVESEVQNKVYEGLGAVAEELGPASEFIPLQQIGSDASDTANNGMRWTLGTAAEAVANDGDIIIAPTGGVSRASSE